MLYPVVVKIERLLCTWPHLGCVGPHLDLVDVLPLGGEPLINHPELPIMILTQPCRGIVEGSSKQSFPRMEGRLPGR